MAFSRYRSQFIPVAALVFSAIGFVYCIIMSFGLGADTLCTSSGCAIVEDFRVFGISPWWAATLIFAAMTAMCFFRMRLGARFVVSFFLVGDCIFLAIMFFVAPCTSCLIAGLIIFCAWLALRIDRSVLITARRVMAGALSATWVVLFLLNLGYAANEAIPAWKIQSPAAENSKINIFFSPSCPACREAIVLFSDRAVFYPVAENEPNYLVIADLARRVQEGQSPAAALEAILAEQAAGGYTPPVLSLWQAMGNKIKIMRNQAAVTRHGHRALPVLMFEGLPTGWAALGKAQDVETGDVKNGPFKDNAKDAVIDAPQTGTEGGNTAIDPDGLEESGGNAQIGEDGHDADAQANAQTDARDADASTGDETPVDARELDTTDANTGAKGEGNNAAQPEPVKIPSLKELFGGPNLPPQPEAGSPDLPPGLLPDFDDTMECGRGAEAPCE